MNIVLLGSPGSGKGTQAEKIAEKYKLFYLQAGTIARELAKNSARVAGIIKSGELIPEDEMSMYVIDYLKNNTSDLKDILFEGFPRFVSQYEALSNFLNENGDDIDLVISLDISESTAVNRISARRICSVCGEVYNLITNPPPKEDTCKCGGKLITRSDDNPETVRARFINYVTNTKILVDYLDEKKVLKRVNGEKAIDEIFVDISSVIDKAIESSSRT